MLTHMGTATTRKTSQSDPVFIVAQACLQSRGDLLAGVWVGSCVATKVQSDTGHDHQALVQMMHGPEDSSATLPGGWGGDGVVGVVVIIISVVIQITKRIQLVTVYKSS